MIENDEKKMDEIIIIYSYDLSDYDLSILKNYGNVFIYDNCYINISIDDILREFKPNYLLFDVRLKLHRDFLTKMTKKGRDIFNIVTVIKWYEIYDDFVDDISPCNIIHEIPNNQPTKSDLDFFLLNPEISEPTCCFSLIKHIKKLGKIYTFFIAQLKSFIIQQALISFGFPPQLIAICNIVI